MGALQAKLGSKKSPSQSTRGRTRSNDGEPRILAREAARATPDEATKTLIYRQSRRGFSVEVLATQFGLGRSRIERIIDEMRARRLLEAKLDFVSDPSFDDPTAVAEILGPSPEPAVGHGSRRNQAPEGLPPYLGSLYEFPLLSREQERHLFLKMNYLKYRAHRLREALEPGHYAAAQLDEVERLQAEALSVKNQIIGANLRLVVSIAKKYAGPTNNLFELISDGNMSLIRAVEKFDARRGFKFSTYASWAIMRNFSRTIPEEKYRRDRFITGHEEMFETAHDDRGDVYQQESDLLRSQEAVRGMLGQLSDRERRILIGRYGIGGNAEQTLEQLGRELGVTKERIRQIESRAREKLRKMTIGQELDLPFD
jgi:RNA polymerase primary sigma factor